MLKIVVSLVLMGFCGTANAQVMVNRTSKYGFGYVEMAAGKWVLKDTATSARYILNARRNVVTAVDSNGDLIWKTNPRKDNNLQPYRIKRSKIDFMSFTTPGGVSLGDSVIYIRWDNSQFGTLSKATGQFMWRGQN